MKQRHNLNMDEEVFNEGLKAIKEHKTWALPIKQFAVREWYARHYNSAFGRGQVRI